MEPVPSAEKILLSGEGKHETVYIYVFFFVGEWNQSKTCDARESCVIS